MRIALALTLLLAPSLGHAGMCAQQSVFMFPTPDAMIPVDVELRISLYGDSMWLYDPTTDDRGTAPSSTVSFALAREGGPTIALRRKELTTSRGTSFALTPEQPLVPNTKYALVANGTFSYGPELGKAHAFAIASYTTGTPIEATSVAIRNARAVVRTKRRGNTKGEVYGPYVAVTFTPPSDAVLFEVTPEGGPTFWKHADKGELDFGAVGECGRVDLELPKHGRAHYALRVVDGAGHTSEPKTVDVDFDRPLKRP